MVPRAGLEPATYGLELHYSIQLSYRGINREDYTTFKELFRINLAKNTDQNLYWSYK